MKVNLVKRLKGLLGLALAVVTFVGLGSGANAAIVDQEYSVVEDDDENFCLIYYALDNKDTTDEDDDEEIFRMTTEMVYSEDITYNLVGSGGKVIVEGGGVYDDYDEENKTFKGTRYESSLFVSGTTYYVKSIEKRTVDLSGKGGKMEEVPILTLTTTPPTTTTSGGSGASQSSSHTHTFDWVTLKTPTATQDGLESYRCTECGYAPNGNTPIAAYPYFVKEALKQIEKAPLNGTATIKSDIFGSVPASVMKAIAARPDLTVDFQLTHQHQKYEIEIPAGTTIDTNETYYGVLKLAALYGLK